RDAALAPLVAAPACRERLRRLVDDELVALRTAEEVLRTGPDAVARSRAVDPTLFLQDEVEARRFFRYWGESRATFLRCFKELEATRRRDARADVDDGDDDSEIAGWTDRADGGVAPVPEPGCDPPSPAGSAAATSPNEPSGGGTGA